MVNNFRDVSVRVEVLGQGASGTVYKMVHVPSLTIVAAMVCMADEKLMEIIETD